MTKLESTIKTVLEQLRSKLASETWESRRRYFNQMLQCAESLGIAEPCGELYNEFIADDNGSPERRSLHMRSVKLVDGNRICSHPRLYGWTNQYSTMEDHMPPNQIGNHRYIVLLLERPFQIELINKTMRC